MWFKRRDIGYKKVYKKWTHEGPSTKRRKNDDHTKAHLLKKDSHVSK